MLTTVAGAALLLLTLCLAGRTAREAHADRSAGGYLAAVLVLVGGMVLVFLVTRS